MQIIGLDKEEVAQAAAQAYPQKYVELQEADLYLRDIEKGTLHIDGISFPVYASTHYAYEDRLVNGNKTRYKIALTAIIIKQDPYEVIYDSYGKYFIAYKEADEIRFVPYEDFWDIIKDRIHVEEEKKAEE